MKILKNQAAMVPLPTPYILQAWTGCKAREKRGKGKRVQQNMVGSHPTLVVIQNQVCLLLKIHQSRRAGPTRDQD